MIQYESRHERNTFVGIDAFPQFTDPNEQPCEVHYELDGELHVHFPDVLVRNRETRELWEVKERRDAEDPQVARRTRLLAAELPRLGYRYRVVLAESVARQPMLANAEMILLWGRAPVAMPTFEALRRLCALDGGITWHRIANGSLGPSSRGAVCRLVLEGVIHLDLCAPLCPDTTLTWNETAGAGGA